MRTEQEVNAARKIVSTAYGRPGLHPTQMALFSGMSVALQWVMRDGGLALEQLIAGRPVAPKTDEEISEVCAESDRRIKKIIEEQAHN